MIVPGCGNGKYLNLNTSVFNIGGDKSTRLSEVAREKENEVSIIFLKFVSGVKIRKDKIHTTCFTTSFHKII